MIKNDNAFLLVLYIGFDLLGRDVGLDVQTTMTQMKKHILKSLSFFESFLL